MRRIRFFWILLLLTSACGLPASPAGTSDPIVLTSTTFLADIAQNVAGDRMQVESLLPVGADPHSYQPTPQDVTKIAESRVLILNGIEYDHLIEGLLENAGGERSIITASDGLEPRHTEEQAGEETGESAAQGAGDPHMWLDPNLVITYVENIRAGLTRYDTGGAAEFQANADAYMAELTELDAWIVDQVKKIPAEKRLLVTNHEALGYFADRYGFSVVGAVIPGVSSDASPSAQQMAGLLDQIRAAGAPAIFLDAGDNPALARQIADEAGVGLVIDLHLESLTDGAPAGTYIEMMRYNVTQIVNALK